MASHEGSLDDFFTAEKGYEYSYTDIDCLDISAHLNADGFTDWASNPRIYVILRLLGRVDVMQDFLRLGLNDLCLPFNKTSQLPRSLGTMRDEFMERQNNVLTTAVALEKRLTKQNHVNLRKDSKFPYESLGPLGLGRYQVDQVRSPYSGELFARKIFKRTQVSKSAQQDFLNELTVLKRIDHEHCVRLVGSYTDRRNFGLLMSPVAECNLAEFFALAESHQSHLITLGTFYGCLAAAVMYLHQNKIRHRDIKPANILVKGSKVYLTDFGISLNWEHLSRSTTTEESGKTLLYCAPEVAEQFQKRNSATDIWSLGCVFVEMLVIRHGISLNDLGDAFVHHSESRAYYQNEKVVADWIQHRLQEPRPNGPGRSLSQITHVMLSRSATDRPGADAIYHMISTLRTREPRVVNPYCGECCVAELETDSEHDSTLSNELTVDGHSNFATPTSPIVTRLAMRPSSPALAATSQRPKSPVHSLAETSTEHGAASPVPTSSEKAFNPGEVTTSAKQQPTEIEDNSRLVPKLSASPYQSALVTPTKFVSPMHPALFQSLSIPEWPVTDLKGNLPRLESSDWNSPKAWKAAIQRDIQFMDWTRLEHPQLANRIDNTRGKELLSLAYMLLYNGLGLYIKPKRMRIIIGIYRPLSPPPIVRIMRASSRAGKTWDASTIRIPMVQLLIAFAGPDAVCTYEDFSKIGSLNTTLASNDMEIFRILLNAGANPDEPHVGRKDVLTNAASRGNLAAVKLLHEYKVHHHGSTLWYAVMERQRLIVSFLLNTGKYADHLEYSGVGVTPLDIAALNGDAMIVEMLLEKGANTRAACARFGTFRTEPLTIAAIHGHLDVVKMLIEEAGVDPDAHPKFGKRALAHVRYVSIRSPVGKYLLSRGAKPPTLSERIIDQLKHLPHTVAAAFVEILPT